MTNPIQAVITGTGLYVPPDVITNDELVKSFNEYVHAHPDLDLKESSSEFILKASGIERRHLVDKKNILDPAVMEPRLQRRADDELSFQAENAVNAAREALKNANKTPADIDAVLMACSNMQRAYPGMAIEVQQALGIQGFAFDMNVACSSATFGLQTAVNMILAGSAKSVLMVSVEIASAQVNFRDRDSHFIFGDAATAVVIERADLAKVTHPFAIMSTKLMTQFSSNVRCNGGFLNRLEPQADLPSNKFFTQNGRAVFKEVVPMAAKFISEHLAENHLTPENVKRYWLHQANINMNQLIMEKILGRAASKEEAPIVLNDYANTGSVGSIIALHLHRENLASGDWGVLCSFGAGYSIGSIILKRI